MALGMIQGYVFGASGSGFGSKLTESIRTQVSSTATSVVDVLHLVSGAFGILVIIFIALAAVFKQDMIKENLKLIISVAVIIGVVWGVTNDGGALFND